jgi:alkylated DNA repair dioxygenase AlkB
VRAGDAAAMSFELLSVPDGDLKIWRHLFAVTEADRLFLELLNGVEWRHDAIQVYGRQIPLPRLTAWFGDEGASYTYSGIKMNPAPWTPALLSIKQRIEGVADSSFNSVLLNLYRDGRDGVAWHQDNEPELGKNPVIGSVSLGETRTFQLKHKSRKDLGIVNIDLGHGSFLLMSGPTQHFWRHRLPKTPKVRHPRINLTFRKVLR